MPHSMARFLRVYASVVMFLVAGVIAVGTEPAAAPADFGNIEAAVAHTSPRRAMRIVSFDGNWPDAKFSFAIDAVSLQSALPLSTFPFEKPSVKTCAQRSLRVVHQS